MFVNDDGEKFCQTLPGQGWQVLIDWNTSAADIAEGAPRFTLEPVIAWATAKVERLDRATNCTDVIFAPLVRGICTDELVLLDSRDKRGREVTYLAPGEKLRADHFAQLRGAYRKGVLPPANPTPDAGADHE
jgi:hypothetical protein